MNIDETDAKGYRSYSIPTHADLLFAYSTFSGFLSWRNGLHGSYFVQSLCQILDKYGKQHDLLSNMTQVARKVALDFESHTMNNQWKNGKKQIPCINSTLIRDIFFDKK